MRSSIQRVILLLASPDITEQEFRELADWLKQGGLDEVLNSAAKVRQVVRKAGPLEPRKSAKTTGTPKSLKNKLKKRSSVKKENKTGDTPQRIAELSQQIEDILGQPHNLRAAEILDLLRRKLKSNVSLNPKWSLKLGIDQLTVSHGASAVLSAAYQIARDLGDYDGEPDWKLRDR